jgi:DNA invertase Pin-like site-specific DNA recombinase
MVERHPIRAIVYARIRMEDALDLPMQAHTLVAFAETRGWTVVAKELEAVAEDATRFPGRERLLKAAAAGSMDVIVVWKLDRIVRGLGELTALLDRLATHGVKLATLADDFDFTGHDANELHRKIRVLATLQKRNHRDQVTSGIREAARAGVKVGRPATSDVHRTEAKALASKGLSQREISRRLGIHPKTVARLLSV